MKKLIILSLLFFSTQKILIAQEYIQYLHIEPFQTELYRDAYPQRCDLYLYLFKNNKVIDTLEYKFRPIVYKDSSFFKVDIPMEKYMESDSLLFITYYFGLYNDGSSKAAMHDFSFTNGKNKPKHVRLELQSNPEGAIVYLFPRFLEDLYPKRIRKKDKRFLEEYRINERTPASTLVEEYVYIAIFKQKGKEKYERRICRPKYIKKVEVVSVDF